MKISHIRYKWNSKTELGIDPGDVLRPFNELKLCTDANVNQMKKTITFSASQNF